MELEYMKNVTEKVLNQIATSHGFSNPRLEFSAAAKKADNFIGQVFRCVLTDDDNPKKRLHLIVKLPPANEERRRAIRVERFFGREAYMYGTVLPALADCYIKKNLLPKDSLFPCTAKTYALLDEDEDKLIIMEDLKLRGFVMKNRHIGLDENHCRAVLRQLARLHAASLALQKDDPALHDSLTENLTENLFSRDEISEHFQRAIDRFRDAIDSRFPLGTPTRNKVESFVNNYQLNMKKILTRNSTLSCITHGDLWVNNILFKHKEGSDTIEDICFLDLQISRFCSPATDIWYFLALCTRRSTRKSFQKFIKVYYDSLCSFLRDLGHNPEEIVTWDLLQRELRKYGTYGWAIGIIVLPAILLEEADMELIEQEMKKKGVVLYDLKEQAAVRFIELLEEAEEFGLFLD